MTSRNRTAAGLGAALLSIGAVPALATASATKSYKGATANTAYGQVTVTIGVANKKIVTISVSTNPRAARSKQLEALALGILKPEALKAQSYKIHIVGGVTSTSDGFVQSLQSALGHAKL